MWLIYCEFEHFLNGPLDGALIPLYSHTHTVCTVALSLAFHVSHVDLAKLDVDGEILEVTFRALCSA